MAKKLTRQARINKLLAQLAQSGTELPPKASVHEVNRAACTSAGRAALGGLLTTREDMDSFLTPEALSLFLTLCDVVEWTAENRRWQLDDKSARFNTACLGVLKRFGADYPPAQRMWEVAHTINNAHVAEQHTKTDEYRSEAIAGMLVYAVYSDKNN